MELFALFIGLIFIILVIWQRPYIDKTRDGKVLLWYGHRQRKYFVLRE